MAEYSKKLLGGDGLDYLIDQLDVRYATDIDIKLEELKYIGYTNGSEVISLPNSFTELYCVSSINAWNNITFNIPAFALHDDSPVAASTGVEGGYYYKSGSYVGISSSSIFADNCSYLISKTKAKLNEWYHNEDSPDGYDTTSGVTTYWYCRMKEEINSSDETPSDNTEPVDNNTEPTTPNDSEGNDNTSEGDSQEPTNENNNQNEGLQPFKVYDVALKEDSTAAADTRYYPEVEIIDPGEWSDYYQGGMRYDEVFDTVYVAIYDVSDVSGDLEADAICYLYTSSVETDPTLTDIPTDAQNGMITMQDNPTIDVTGINYLYVVISDPNVQKKTTTLLHQTSAENATMQFIHYNNGHQQYSMNATDFFLNVYVPE